MFESAYDYVTASALSYVVIAGFVWLDAWFPVVPGESLIITGGVLAAQGDLAVGLVVLAGTVGAILGDNFTYTLGDRLGGPAASRFFRGERAQRRLGWAQDQLRVRPWVIVSGRFIPGGRTAVAFASGLLEVPWRRRFLPLDGAGATIWAVLAGTLGYFFGRTFADSVWLPLTVSLAVAALISVLAEFVRRRTARPEGR